MARVVRTTLAQLWFQLWAAVYCTGTIAIVPYDYGWRIII